MPETFFDGHLMVQEPSKWVEPCAKAGITQMTFHIESTYDNPQSVVELIKSHNMKAGIALKPDTMVDPVLTGLLDSDVLDMVLVMTVNPGFGGQGFIEEPPMSKIQELRKAYPNVLIQVDGGVNADNATTCVNAGCDCIVAGTAIFKAEDRESTISTMRATLDEKYNS